MATRSMMTRTTLFAPAAATLALLVTSTGCSGASASEDWASEQSDLRAGQYSNPVIPMYERPAGVASSEGVPGEASEGCPDPQGLRTQGGDYYIYCTSYTWRFSRLNGFPVFKSKSRTPAGPWEPVGSIIPDRNGSREAWPPWIEDANGTKDGDFWGPDVHQLPNGKFAAGYSAPCGSARCVGIAWSDGPDGPWTHDSSPFVTPRNNGAGGGDSYDPNLLITSQQELFLYWVVPGRGVYVRRVSAGANGRLSWQDASATPTLIADRARGQRGEGPYVVEHDGGFYEYYSTGSLLDGYYVGVRRGDRPDAPFTVEGPEPVVHPNAHFVATGGNSVLRNGQGREFLVYHAIVVPPGGGCPRRDPEYGGNVAKTADNPHCRVQGERQAMIDELVWKTFPDGHDWPVLENGTGTPSVGVVSLD